MKHISEVITTTYLNWVECRCCKLMCRPDLIILEPNFKNRVCNSCAAMMLIGNDKFKQNKETKI